MGEEEPAAQCLRLLQTDSLSKTWAFDLKTLRSLLPSSLLYTRPYTLDLISFRLPIWC